VEVKCPNVSRLKPVNPITVPFLYEVDGELTLKRDHDYYFQIQKQHRRYRTLHCNFYLCLYLGTHFVFFLHKSISLL